MVDGILACWTHWTDGDIHTAEDDQDAGWVAPTMTEHGPGEWQFADPQQAGTNIAYFHPDAYFGGPAEPPDVSDDDGEGPAPDEPTRARPAEPLAMAAGDDDYDDDWDGIEAADDPEHAALRLLHVARSMHDTSRWWTQRWTCNAISMLGRAGKLRPRQTYELMRQLRLTAISHMEELWQAVLTRRHGKDTSKLRARIQKEWRQLKTAVGQATDRRGHVMPGWVVVANWPSYRMLAALRRWQKLRRQTTIRGGQRTLHSHFARAAPPASAKHQTPSATLPTPVPNSQPPPAAAVTTRPTPAPDGPNPSTGATATARRAPPPPPAGTEPCDSHAAHPSTRPTCRPTDTPTDGSCDGDCDHKEAADAAPAAHGPSQTSGESRRRTGRPKRATQAETRRNSRTQPQFTAN
jgi:hypothetical protein